VAGFHQCAQSSRSQWTGLDWLPLPKQALPHSKEPKPECGHVDGAACLESGGGHERFLGFLFLHYFFCWRENIKEHVLMMQRRPSLDVLVSVVIPRQ
jgi:hypothetical protein